MFSDTKWRPPKIVTISKEVHATIKHSVTLECLAGGNPTPVVTWMKGLWILAMGYSCVYLFCLSFKTKQTIDEFSKPLLFCK